MAEAFLQLLIENLASLIEGEIGLLLGVDKEMKKLSNTLTTIQNVLEDAEDKQFQSKAIQNWLSKFNEIAFEIEDILDECAIDASKLKHKGSKFNLVKTILYNHKIGRRMKEVAEKLDGIAADRHNFHFREVIVQQTTHVDWRRETGSAVNEPDHIYGRDEDKEIIVDVLLNQVADCENLSVLPIIGVGGLGKTTLAQLVFNDERVSVHFQTKLWVCVSDNFDLKNLVQAMIESATGSAPNFMHMDALEFRLREVLNGKKYLLILDDVWNENQEDWVKLKRILLACGSKGSAIVVTTRLQNVADIMRTLPIYGLKELSEEHCWLLFKLRAFGQENGQQHPKLENIGRQIVKKCGGVPLAAKALGGLLRFKREENEWIQVKESEIWNLPEDENSILPVLRLSYHHLNFVLKRCFVYCAVFPKDFVIDKQDLIFRWMAHGCISSNKNQDVEDVGDQVWKEFVLRSFFHQVDRSGRQTIFMMHDLVHDLAQSIMMNRIPGEEMEGSNRRWSLLKSSKANDPPLHKLSSSAPGTSTSASNNKIREIHWREYRDQTSSSSITLQVSTLTTIMNYNRLRILKLVDTEMEELPSSIAKLKHLRYLDLSRSSIHTLPQTFCSLWNLRILILNGCSYLKSLPKNMRCMTNLRHILLEGCSSLSHMPSGIGELASLKTLSLFLVGDKIGNQLDELEHLNLGGRLEIKHLERGENHFNAKKANLGGKPNLRVLVLYWEGYSTSESAKMDEKVLEALEPHPNLKTLEIRGFKGGCFPLWKTETHYVTKITIEDCPNCIHLTPLGDLPHLKSLCLSNLPALEYIDDRPLESVFPSLKDLTLYNLPNLKRLLKKDFEKKGGLAFKNIGSLYIISCQLLILPSLPTLKEFDAWSCSLLNLCSFSSNLENLISLRLGFDTESMNDYIPGDTWEGPCNLKELFIWNAEEFCFPEKWFRGLKHLQVLVIDQCNIGICFPDGWLGHLTELEGLTICNCSDLVEVAEEIQNLHNLKSIELGCLPNMVSLPECLQDISTLQSLTLYSLPCLTSLPDGLGNLASLLQMNIADLPRVTSLPSTMQGMTNLKSLYISGCPQLATRCQTDGEDWYKIAHIPQLEIQSDF